MRLCRSTTARRRAARSERAAGARARGPRRRAVAACVASAMCAHCAPAAVRASRLRQRDRAEQRLRLQRAAARAAREPMPGDATEIPPARPRAPPSAGRRRAPRLAPRPAGRCRREATVRGARPRRRRPAADVAARRGEQRLHVIEQRRRNVDGGGLALPFEQRGRIGQRRHVAICARRSPPVRSSRSAAGSG